MKKLIYVVFTIVLLLNNQTQAQSTIAVGSLSGNVSNSNGAVTYNIPIDCPIGINGMQPSLALVYSSQTGESPYGFGWGVSGLSVITKSTKNIFTDNSIDGIEDANSNVYYLNGQRLLLKDFIQTAASYTFENHSDTVFEELNSIPNSTYETQIKSYSKIESFGVAGLVTDANYSLPFTVINRGPSLFKITSKDGTLLEYTISKTVYYDENHSFPLSWNLSKVLDKNGNYIVYEYETSEGQTIIKSIKYTGNGSHEPTLYVEFNYETLESSELTYRYIGNTKRVINKFLLDNITIKSNSSVLRQYLFTYEKNNNHYYLKDATLSGTENMRLNATTFEWGEDNNTTAVNNVNLPQSTELQSVNDYNKHWFSTDVNNDGLDDAVCVYPAEVDVNGITQTKNYLQVFKSVISNDQQQFEIDNKYEIPELFSFDDTKSVNPSLRIADILGNNQNKFIIPELSENNTVIKFNVPGVGSVQQTLQTSYEIPLYDVGDINNDGKDEIIYIEKQKGTNSFYAGKIGYNIGGSTIWEDKEFTLPNDPKALFVADFDADGLDDVMILTDSLYQLYKNYGGNVQADGILHPNISYEHQINEASLKTVNGTIKICDLNNDGLPDFITNEKESSIWNLMINNGKYFTINPIIDNENVADYGLRSKRYDCILTDFNHDGKQDVILTGAYYTYSEDLVPDYIDEEDEILISTHHLYNYTKSSWYANNQGYFEQTMGSTFSENGIHYNNNFSMTGDFDGDGREDVLTYGLNIINGNDKSENLYLHSQYNNNFNGNLLTNVIDGMGNSTQITYRPLTYPITADNKTFYTSGNSSVYPLIDVKEPMYCISKISKPNGQGGTWNTEFSYTEARSQLTGAGYLGFTSQTTSDLNAEKKAIETVQLNNTTFLTEKTTQQVTTLNNSPISYSETFINNTQTGLISESQVLKTTGIDYLTGLTQTTEYLNYDTYGNPTLIKTTVGDIVTTQAMTYGQYGSWCPDKPETVTITKTQNGESYTRTSSFAYDTKGNLTSSISDVGDVNQVTKTYSLFNEYGAPTKTEVTANGNTRTASIQYTPSGRFILSKTDVLGQSTTYDWNETEGLLNSSTDRLGTTSYSYNGLGQITSVTNPIGIISTSNVEWTSLGNTYGAAYKTSTHSTKSAPVYTWYDKLGRELVSESKGLNDQTIRVFTEYYPNGKNYRVSEPTFETTPQTWAQTNFYNDPYGRLSEAVTVAGSTTYSYQGLSTIVTTPSGTQETILNISGQLQTNKVNGKAVDYTYYPSGLLKTATPEGGQPVTSFYDLQGNRVKIIDPDAGTVRDEYNGFGELLLEKQKITAGQDSVTTVNTYDNATGLLLNTTRGTETTVYTYDGLKRLSNVEIAEKHKVTLTYGDFDRVTDVDEQIESRTFNKHYVYDLYGRLENEVFPTGYTVQNSYDDYSNIIEVDDMEGRTIWVPTDANARGQITHAWKGAKETVYGYDARGFNTSIQAQGIVDMSYVFDTKGNMQSRTDNLTAQQEQFTYDALNRLTNWDVYKNNALVKQNSQSYDAVTGNVTSRTDLDNFTMSYGGKRPDGSDIGPHALATVNGVPHITPSADLSVTYTDFNKITSLNEGDKSYSLIYGVDLQRKKSIQTINGTTTTRYYLGDYEEETDGLGNIRKIHYLSGGAVYVETMHASSQEQVLYYGYTDNQGSLIALTDEAGNVVEKYAYDPWGARRNPADWSQKDNRTAWLLNRGYTGHEHLDAFGIINMNGRVYDPATAQFFSPDPFIQEAGNWQNYNRYSYVFNNPLIFTDPSGYRKKNNHEKEMDYMYGYTPVREPNTFQSVFSYSKGGAGYKYDKNTNSYTDANGNWVSFNDVFNNYIEPNSISITGENAIKFIEYTSDGYNIYHLTYKPANINTIIFSYGDVGKITAYQEGDKIRIDLENPFAGLMAGLNDIKGGNEGADMMKYAGFMVGNTSNILTYWNKSHLYNEFWHQTKSRGIATVFNKARWNNSMAIKWRNVQTAPFQGVSKTAGRIVGVGAGGVLALADVAMSGELKWSQLINAGMAGISWTGVGSVVAGVWFVADFGTMGVNYLFGNGAVGLGDIIDNATGTYEMYEGLY